jgi:SAM-dependent methyltransferase
VSDLERLYGDDYYETWGIRQNPGDVWNMKVKTCLLYLDCLADYLAKDLPAPRLLDIGCAHGFMLDAARQRGWEVVGIEISPAASTARARGFTVYDRPLEQVNLPGGSFDVITAIDVIEHVPDVRRFTLELYRILKPGGVLLIVTPDVGSSTAKIMKNAWPHYKQEHLGYFTKGSLSMLLRRSGLTVRSIRCGRKYITFDYALGLLRRYTPGPLTSLLNCIGGGLPRSFKNIPVCLPTEMIAIAQRHVSSQMLVKYSGRTSIRSTDNVIPETVYSQT